MTLQQEQAGLAERWPERYSWAYVDVARRQLSVLMQGMRTGVISPSARDTVRLTASLDDLDMQIMLLRQLIADSTAQGEQYQYH